MIQTGIESRVKIQDIVSSQLPNFILDESPKTADFLKQYYISQEFQSGVVDVAENLDQYLDLDNLTPEILTNNSTLSVGISTQEVDTVIVSSTKGFPNQYGLFKIDDEIITYTGLTTNTFTGLTRGFSGITSYHAELNEEELIFSTSNTGVHTAGSSIQNLSSLFLKEFYNKFKYTFAPGFENLNFDKNLNAGNFLKEIKSFYETKGTNDAIKILFRVLYGVDPNILNLEDLLLKPSAAEYLRRETVIVEILSGNPIGLVGQTIKKIEKINDPETQASVSEVEPFTRQGKQYFKFSLFIGYASASLVEGNFKITPSSKSIENVSIGSSVITVDSTVGFSTSGEIISGINTVSYIDKTINQFLGCSGITSSILPSDSVHSNEIYFGYEEGDLNKKVEFRITGILSKFNQTSENIVVSEGDIMSVKNLGVKIPNSSINKTNREVFANSWIYNTSSFFEIDNISSSVVTLKSIVDRSTLKVGDFVEIVDRNNPSIVIFPSPSDSQPYVSVINDTLTITVENLDSGSWYDSNVRYNVRKKLNKPNSVNVPISYDNIASDVSNVYFDEDSGYAASNSLPSAVNSSLPNTPFFENIDFQLNQVTLATNGLQDLNGVTGKYKSLKVSQTAANINLLTGDRIFYESSGNTFNTIGSAVGIDTGSYFIEIVDKSQQLIRLYTSRSFIPSGSSLELDYPKDADGNVIAETHSFTLYSQRSKEIQPKKSFKKFLLTPNIKNGGVDETIPGTIGKLINGVEIFNYKTNDKIYFGPVSKLNLLSGGSGYDVINPPKIEVSTGIGTTALAQLCVKGKIVDAFIDPQDFDIDRVVSIGITGGNGTGAVLEPIIGKRSREITFDATAFTSAKQTGVGNADGDLTILTFKNRHNLNVGDRVIYNSNNQASIGQISGTLVSNQEYFVSIVNDKSIRFFQSQNQAFSSVSAASAVGLRHTAGGQQRLIVGSVNNTILGVNVLAQGEGYENRKLFVQPVGISTIFNTITFGNHNFKDKDKIVYEHPVGTASTIVGLSTLPNQQYIVTKIDNNSFKLSDAGIGGTSLSNFDENKFVNLKSTGIGTQTFKYPDIVATIEYVGIKTATNLTAGDKVSATITPVVRGELSDIYLYEKGTGYGSTILNFENNPVVTIKNGSGGTPPELKPIINTTTGGISTISIGNTGSGYFSTPNIEVVDSLGIGNGAKLRVIMNTDLSGDLTGSISAIEVVSAGIGYSESTTSIRVTSSGVGAVINAKVRSLNVNNNLKYGNSKNRLEENDNILQNVVCGYSTIPFNDNESNVSNIIGWAYDGNPIYGPFGYTDPEKKTNDFKKLVSGYQVNTSSVIDRPTGFADGFFIEDHIFKNNGDLDEFNGRFEINNDYPNGIYAYHATIDSLNNPTFPYFIGNKFKSRVIEDNFKLDQSFNFSNSSLRRNTLPYNVSDSTAGNDFITEANEIQTQIIEIETVESGSVNKIEVIESGTDQKVGDVLNFDNTGTGGDGLIAKVSSIKGEFISSITTDTLTYDNSVIVKESEDSLRIIPPNNHNLSNQDLVIISGLTSSLSSVNGSYIIGVTSLTSSTISTITANAGAATTEIYISDISSNISIGNSVGIGSEIVKILNVYDEPNIITVQRGVPGISHSISTPLYIIPDSFTIQKSVDNFNSKRNQKVFFNPSKAVGFGTTAGGSSVISFSFGNTRSSRAIPNKGIYLENHPFVTNQKLSVALDGGNIGISNTALSTIYAMPSTVFAVKKNTNIIGIKTGIGTDSSGNQFPEVFFRSIIGGGGDSDKYSFETNFVQQKVNVKNIKNTVTLGSSFHQLRDNDEITLSVKPNISVGLGTLSQVSLKRDSSKGYLFVDSVECLTSGIKTTDDQTGSNQFTLENHNFVTGQKVKHFATSTPVGLGNSEYFVSVIDNNKFKLCDSFINATINPPKEIDIISTVGISTLHTFSKINPQFIVEKNNNLVIDTSDTSLSGYKFKIYHDKNFVNEFVSTGSSTGFNVPVGIITEGLTGSKFTIGFGNSLPDKLYYNIEKLGIAATADTDVQNYSEIQFVNSNLNGTFKISNVGVNTFTFNSLKEPQRTIHTSTNCDDLTYSTTSGIVTGAINSVNIVTGGSNYKKLPSFTSVGVTTVKDVNVLPKSTTIGNIKKVRIINEGFEYASDSTLQPEALIPSFVQLKGSKRISSVEIVNGGSNYVNSPRLLVIDTEIGTPFPDSALNAILSGSSINSVQIEQSPTGISVGNVNLVAIDNTNGVSIQKVNSTLGISTFTLSITTPATGYNPKPFAIGDSVFIEGLQKVGTAGSGFNSSDYGYKLLRVSNYETGGTFDKVTIDVSEYSTNTGIAVTDVASFGSLINSKNYPSFNLNLVEEGFTIGEKIIINDIERDLTVTDSGENFVKLIGLYELQNGDNIIGAISRNQARIQNVIKNQGQFEVNYSLIKDLGWETNVGKLNEDIQVLSNNDYYQNLSYSIQSPITWNDLKSPVNNLVHTAGFKNFSDTGITSSSSAFPIGGQASISIFLDILPSFIEKVRVDSLYNFDNARDTFVGVGATDLVIDRSTSKYIQLQNINITDFIEARTNDVINIDDISFKYSNLESDPNIFTDILQVQSGDSFNRILVLTKNLDNTQNEIAELIILNNDSGVYLLEKNKLNTENADFTKFEIENISSKDFLRFTPTDEFKFDVDYDIKTLQSKFNSTLTGIGTSSFGLANISGSVVGVASTTAAAGITSSIISIASTVSDSLYVATQVTDTVTNEMNYVETLIAHDGTDTSMSEAFFDTNQGSFSSNFIGSFGASLSGGVLSFEITNKEPNPIRVRSSIIGFGSTGAGIGTYRFLASGQEDGSERTQLVESKFDEQIGISTIATLSKDLFLGLKATAHVATATSEALHQVFLIHDNTDIIINQSEFLSVGSTSGIGTFHARFVSDDFVLEFVPDNQNGITTVRSLNEVFYKLSDEKSQSGLVNNPVPIDIGKLTQTGDIAFYNAINGNRINRRNFELTSNNTPIFAKTFDPSNTSMVNFGTGKFTIKDHFFRTNEELIYTPQASFVGVGSTPMMYKPSSGNIDTLPTTVFAIKDSDDVFSISTTRSGTAVTFMSAGEGNNHQFEMSKGLTKALITIDGLVQHPIAQTNLVYQLANNGGSIGTASTIFSMSGISTINIENLLKIDNEFIRITNVGFGTTSIGPVSGLGTFPLIQGQRGYVGSSATNHSDFTNSIIFKGAYNIAGKEIHFTEAPRGNNRIDLDESNLPPARSDFEGRVYFRNNYDTNILYDNISNQFTGIGQTFDLTTGGIATSGIGQVGGNGVLFINNIFQRPTTDNNSDGNFNIADVGSATTITFTGITTIADGNIIINESDINQNDLPRGGVIVSLGSTGGLGYAPLVPAKVKPQLTGFGTITSLVGVAYSGAVNGITTASYDHLTGLLDITTSNKHNLRVGYNDEVILSRLEFSCAAPHAGVTTTFFPDGTIGDRFSVVSIASTNTFTTQVGTSTIPHTYVGGGISREWFGDLTFGSGYNTVSVAASVFDPGYEHVFASASTNAVSVTGGGSGPFTPTDATYDPVTGDLVLVISGAGIQTHGLTITDTVSIAPTSISFTCSKDNFRSNHAYPRSTDPVAGIATAITSTTTNSITVNVGKNVGTGAVVSATVGVGGTLIFSVSNGGTNYKEPEIFVPSPSYDDMSIVGVSRLGLGSTTDTGVGVLISADVNVSGVQAGIGSTLFSVKNFELSRTGYNFRKGDKFTPVGLVTDKNLPKPISDFILEVTEVYEDNFALWQFGELDYIDSIKNLQDGSRVTFPLLYNGELLSVQVDPTSDIIAQNLLLIFVNGVVQKPGINYEFEGGTTFSFKTAPTENDEIAVYIYKGTNNVDSVVNTSVDKVIEEGDEVQLVKINGISTSVSQDNRTVFNLTLKDRFETNLYTGEGVDANNFRPMHLYKQKVDKIIGSRVVPKTRDSIEPQIYPTAKIISDITTSNTLIYVDNADFFNYEDEGSPEVDAKIISNTPQPLIGITTLTSTISVGGTVSGLTIVGGGSGFASAPSLSISAPPTVGVGVGTTATATLTITNGIIDGFAITNPGLGYTVAPSVLVQSPTTVSEGITSITSISGFSGIVTGIRQKTISGIAALQFNLKRPDGVGNYTGLSAGDYIFINNTRVGHGVTSKNETGVSVVSIGSTFVDNVYQIQQISNVGVAGSIMAHATMSAIDLTLDVTGENLNLGNFSWGKLTSLNRSSTPISIGVTGLTVDSGLSTFPTIQRSGGDYTLRNTGALPKTS